MLPFILKIVLDEFAGAALAVFYIQSRVYPVDYWLINIFWGDMFPGMPVQANKQERKLVKAFKSLDDANKASLIAFAEFLVTRSGDESSDTKASDADIPKEPLDIPRPDEESVVKAIKRLSATYPMVDKESILHPISDLMTAHMLQGKEALRVIDELEVLFENEYKNNK